MFQHQAYGPYDSSMASVFFTSYAVSYDRSLQWWCLLQYLQHPWSNLSFPNLLHCFTITPPHTPWSQSAQPLFQSKPNLSPIRYQPSRLEASINLWQPCKSNLPTTDPLQNTPNPTSTSHPPSPIHPLLLHPQQPPLNLLLIRANPWVQNLQDNRTGLHQKIPKKPEFWCRKKQNKITETNKIQENWTTESWQDPPWLH